MGFTYYRRFPGFVYPVLRGSGLISTVVLIPEDDVIMLRNGRTISIGVEYAGDRACHETVGEHSDTELGILARTYNLPIGELRKIKEAEALLE